jgi:small nuclear ribonucleoprotein (snRNP)-like protein
MKASRTIYVIGTVVMMLMFISGEAMAESKIVEFEDINLNAAATISDNLKALDGKLVYVTVSSGQRIGGTVKSVSNNLLHLQKLTEGKDFHDALIRIDQIILIDAKVRGQQR